MRRESFSQYSFSHLGCDYTIASLANSDLDDIWAIETRSHKHPWQFSHIASSLKSHSCLGLFDTTGRLCAYAVLSLLVEDAELLLFVVDQKHQKKGIGKAFLDSILRHCTGNCERMFLEVRCTNLAAIALYESLGFNQVGVRPGYYDSGERTQKKRQDAFIFACELLA